MVKGARWFTGLTALASLSGACVAVLGLDELQPRKEAESVDSGPPPSCEDFLDEAPKRPAEATAPAGDPQIYSFAVKTLDLGVDLDQALPGFNLDHTKTTDLETNGCTFSPGDQGVILQYTKDSANGVDNVMSKLLGLMQTLSPEFKTTAIDEKLKRGKFGLVLIVDGWNGTSDDPDVRIKVLPALGLERPPNAPDAGSLTPTFTREDRWRPDSRFDLEGGRVPMTASQAWVSGDTIVAKFDELTLPFRPFEADPKPFDVHLLNVWVKARITRNADGPVAFSKGTIGGRLRTNDLFRETRHIQVRPSMFACSMAPLMALLRKQSCMVRDVREDYCDDGKGLPCQALSFGANFEAYSVDALGEPQRITNEDYADAGYLPPEDRCTKEADAPEELDCEEPDAG